MIFDQFSRYKACSDLLRQAGIKSGSAILDIGSGPECLFEKFVPDMTTSFVDPLIPPSSGERQITGSVFSEELDGQRFDCVTAVDVLEHIQQEKRKDFLERMSSLSSHVLVIGFPTSESSDAFETDQAINEQYKNTTGHEYSWLKEHYEYGLPSLSETMVQLQDLGWHCQAVGHGHAPWLREFLAFVICALDIPELEDLVLSASEKFNKEFYLYDFRPPYYRQFVIASKTPLPTITIQAGKDEEHADARFSEFMSEIREEYSYISLRLMSELETQLASAGSQRDTAIVDLAETKRELEAAMAERDRAVAEKDNATTDRDLAVDMRDKAMGEMDDALRERDIAMAGQNNAVVERDEAIRDLDKSMADLANAVIDCGKAIDDRDMAIAARNKAMDARDEAMDARDKAIAARDKAIAARDKALTVRDKATSARNKAIAARDKALSARDDSINNTVKAMAERDTALVEKELAVSERQGAIVERDKAMAECEAATAARDVALAFINQIRGSHSWRITRPLRFVARLVRYGLITSDRYRIANALRNLYHNLPLPVRLKRIISSTYRRFFGRSRPVAQPTVINDGNDQFVAIKPVPQDEKTPDYIVWGVIDWHFRYQRPQHLASEIAASNRRVFYISEQLIDRSTPGFDVEALDASGRLFQVKLYVSGAPTIYSTAPSSDALRQLRASIGELMNWADMSKTVSLVQHAFWYDVANCLPNSRMVYDCMDHHEGFGNTAAEILALERALIKHSDLTVTTSGYLDQVVSKQTDRRVLIRNAGEYEHFSQQPETIYRDEQGRRIIGYYGAIAEWFDQDLVETLAKRFPECLILLVGADSVNAKKRLGRLHNVKFTGEVPYADLPYYLYGFDICTLPFKVVPLTLATNPVKVYEYLSAGKTVVSVDLPELQQFGELVKLAPDVKEFVNAVARSLDQPATEDEINKRRTFAQQQTWRHRANALIDSVETQLSDPLVSVVVVTYNNLDMTKACLYSLDKYSDYTTLEIIVVDNASSDGSPEFLTQWVSEAPNRKLVLNDDNKGFAAGNNQGLEIASGEFLVMLNNDTYVTPGWVRTLMRHLQRDTSIGLIGPVTNNIGNEARIDIYYANMEEMIKESALYTRRHICQLMELRTAAFFCVMMPSDIYQKVGPLDEAFGRGFFEDDDYCRRVEHLGFRIMCAEDVFIHHHLSASFDKINIKTRQKLFEENKKTYEAKWGNWIPHQYR